MSKYKCPNCKRAVDVNKEFCPFCSTPNPNIEKNISEGDSEDSGYFNNEQMDDFFNDEFENIHDEMGVSEAETDINDDSDELYEDMGNYISDDFIDDEIVDDNENNYSNTITNNQNKREKINWSDEKVSKPSKNEDMFDQNGMYYANYDGFYDDTLPKIANEVDSLLKSKEKAILKVVASIVGIVAIIVYLTLTL